MFTVGILIVFFVIQKDFCVESSVCTYTKTCYSKRYRRCGLFGWSRCGYTHSYSCNYNDCCSGWKDGPTGRCNTPICHTPCLNGGTCIRPDTCSCPVSHDGKYCQTLLCSHLSPCFPGTCSYPDKCACLKGFGDPDSGCLQFTSDNNYPVINDCELTLAHIRRKDNAELFFFNHPCSFDEGKDTIWSNQELFNYVNFTIESQYNPISYIPPPPSYVSEYKFGIVKSQMHVIHSKLPRDGGSSRYIAFNKRYTCPSLSSTVPESSISSCHMSEENYKINIEHDDIIVVSFSSSSGGFRKLFDIVNNRHYKSELYVGKNTEKKVELRFDFIAPVHCSEQDAAVKCNSDEEPIGFEADITKDLIKAHWNGWSDGLSGIAYYFLEAFELKPNIHGDLTELHPIKPISTWTFQPDSQKIQSFIPENPGMYSFLLRASDMANNSKIARRLVLYDNESSITLTKPGFQADKKVNIINISIGDGGMHVISAIQETGYMWQTSVPGEKTHIVLDWQNHFVNKLHHNKKLLNKVIPYPTQFAELEESGILRSKKYVAIDDNDGMRTVNPIPNKNGIVKFEIKRVFTDDRQVPTGGWEPHPLVERYEIREDLDDGSHVRLWVRATDVMNNTLADYTEVHIDNTGPRVASEQIQLNVESGMYSYNSRITFIASDDGSGVHKLAFKLFSEDGQELYKDDNVMANRNNASDACEVDPSCNCVLNTCFLREQTINIDNCWFLLPQEELNKSATVVVDVFNQALLTKELVFNISKLSALRGLEEYSGPTNIRVEENQATGVRLVWDLPEKASCYGRADIKVILVSPDGSTRTVDVHNEGTFVDLVGLSPDNTYSVSLKLGYRGNELAEIPFAFKTAQKDNFLGTGALVGIAVGIVVFIAIIVVIFVVLLRRGHMQPVRRGLTAMSVKYRKSLALFRETHRHAAHNKAYDVDSVYMYGEMDFNDIEMWHFKRADIVFESKLTSGNFADIYLATNQKTGSVVVAKTLKKGWSQEDELVMKAKINFCATQIGHHINILNFEGAVVYDSEIGPFLLNEFCSNGPLNEFLLTIRCQNTEETYEKLLRFGIGIVKGMEYLAERKIVHRRLAARNILLDADLEIKVAGFGPQPQTGEDDGSRSKKERIPIKWMAPECLKSTADATEKSDVWSYAIVLWEIFSLGEKPYERFHGRDIPGKLKEGYRLPKPEQCDDKWYHVMRQAWSESPKDRPSFSQIKHDLEGEFIPATTSDYYYSIS